MADLTAPDTTTNSCCAPEQQATCCEPSAKADCCGHGDGCGCDAGRAPTLASLGCGKPTAVAELHEGETVLDLGLLDLGSGGGIDTLLSAKRVGPTGKAHRVLHPAGASQSQA